MYDQVVCARRSLATNACANSCVAGAATGVRACNCLVPLLSSVLLCTTLFTATSSLPATSLSLEAVLLQKLSDARREERSDGEQSLVSFFPLAIRVISHFATYVHHLVRYDIAAAAILSVLFGVYSSEWVSCRPRSTWCARGHAKQPTSAKQHALRPGEKDGAAFVSNAWPSLQIIAPWLWVGVSWGPFSLSLSLSFSLSPIPQTHPYTVENHVLAAIEVERGGPRAAGLG